jgi:sulfite exporter TauE/SafE
MMAMEAGAIGLGAAFIAGLAGSGHCAAMCGGVAGALAMRARMVDPAQKNRRAQLALGLAYNLARISSYALAGALAGLLGHTLLRAVDVAPLSLALRVLAGFIMLAAGGRLLFGWRLLEPIEAAGAGLWRRIAPWTQRGARRGGLSGAIGLGLAWGWLPCGLTYSMLLLAATTASTTTGALIMAAFGLGTLPSMLTATLAFDRAARTLAARASLRNVAGALLVAFGVWTGGSALYHALAHDQAGHGGAHAAQDAGSAMPETMPTAPVQPATGHESHPHH